MFLRFFSLPCWLHIKLSYIELSPSAQLHIASLKETSTYPRAYLYYRIVNAKLFIDKYFHTSIDLDSIANEAHFSKYHFIRLFKSIYNKTPHQYLTSTRLGHAKMYLEQGMPVADTCYMVGFDSITTFTGLFKKNFRQTPAAYQHAYNKRQQSIQNSPLKFIPNCFAEQNGWTPNSNFEEAGHSGKADFCQSKP